METFGVAPMGRCATTIQKPCRCQQEGTRADRDQARAACVGGKHASRRVSDGTSPSDLQPGITSSGLAQHIKALVDSTARPAFVASRPAVRWQAANLYQSAPISRTGEAEDLGGDAELERAKPVIGERRDEAIGRGGYLWHDPYDKRQCSHWRECAANRQKASSTGDASWQTPSSTYPQLRPPRPRRTSPTASVSRRLLGRT